MNADTNRWSEWQPFPDPRRNDYLTAPFGAGVYHLKNIATNEDVYIGEGANVAYRMTSLLPKPFGQGNRDNSDLRDYVLKNIRDITYRTHSCDTKEAAKSLEQSLHARYDCKFIKRM